jgi:hypothetical protein
MDGERERETATELFVTFHLRPRRRRAAAELHAPAGPGAQCRQVRGREEDRDAIEEEGGR